MSKNIYYSFPTPTYNSQSLDDVINKDLHDLDLSLTPSVLKWAVQNSEIMMLMRYNENLIRILDFENRSKTLKVTFYQDDDSWPPLPALYIPHKDLIAIRMRENMTPEDILVMKAFAMHEFGHSLCYDYGVVGKAFDEGFANWFQKLYCGAALPPQIAKKMDRFDSEDNNKFSLDLVESTIQNVYSGDLNRFMKDVKLGNEEKFIETIDAFLANRNCRLNAKEVFRHTSMIAHNSPQVKYFGLDETKSVLERRKPILNLWNNEIKQRDLISLSRRKSSCGFIVNMFETIQPHLDKNDYRDLSATFDRELGESIVELEQSGRGFFNKRLSEQKEKIVSIFKKSGMICKIPQNKIKMVIHEIQSQATNKIRHNKKSIQMTTAEKLGGLGE